MLDEDEYQVATELYRKCLRGIKESQERRDVPVAGDSIDLRFQPLRRWYAQLTGYQDMNQNAIMHHRIALYGPPCEHCGKVLRTPKAKRCFECGKFRD